MISWDLPRVRTSILVQNRVKLKKLKLMMQKNILKLFVVFLIVIVIFFQTSYSDKGAEVRPDDLGRVNLPQ